MSQRRKNCDVCRRQVLWNSPCLDVPGSIQDKDFIGQSSMEDYLTWLVYIEEQVQKPQQGNMWVSVIRECETMITVVPSRRSRPLAPKSRWEIAVDVEGSSPLKTSSNIATGAREYSDLASACNIVSPLTFTALSRLN